MLTSTSKYALRVLVNLVGTESGDWVPGRVLSTETEIPPNYLAKVLLALANAGLVETLRGRGGGYRLTRSAGEITLIDAVEVFEGVRAHPSCLLGIHEECSDANPCSAHASFRDIRARYVAFLEGTSIADAARMESLPRPRRS